MDPAAVVTAVTMALGYLVRLLYRLIKEWSEVRKAELAQNGLSERVRSLPAGSRLVEKDGDRQVEITVGGQGRPKWSELT
ncbi:hypothetical protein OG936_38350 (plasmid) [Streptomyces sp. NBC_00846]|uniref:hypothetical protein n=1 Tax=Streptomyces sp. NBC_00846 TaxID=2975849 RepID=UPI002F91960C|nr:hypothetical protein OG936_38350 [Streptomyces sp. NBC_00846]